MRGTRMFIVLAGLLYASSTLASWPRMAEAEMRVGVDTSARRLELKVPLIARDGSAKYSLLCRGGSMEFLDEINGPGKILFVPDLMCLLLEGDVEQESSLLAEDDVSPWHTRGQFRWSQLVGSCGAYPQYGVTRTFRLRGFELTLEAQDLVIDQGKLAYFVLRIAVRDAPSAKSAYAERPGFLPPDEGCTVVRRGNAPRMCRNQSTLSYELCRR